MSPRFLLLPLLCAAGAAFAQPAAPAVRTIKPVRADAAVITTAPGRSEPAESARLFTRATGLVQERRFDIGDPVKAGDILAVIGVPDLDRAVEAARAAVEQAEVRAANARTLAGRSSSLLGARVLSQEEADIRATDAAAADAALRVARAELARLVEQQGFATVRAPFDGIIAARNFDRGDRVRGDAATAEGWLYQLVRLDTLRFTIQAAPELALRLAPGMAATVTFAEFPGSTFPAEVVRTSRIFDPGAGTMRVELKLDNPGSRLPAGLSGVAAFQLRAGSDTYKVPANTLVLREGRPSLATVVGGKVAYLEVRAGRNLGSDLEVNSATLSPATEVIINPNALLREGDAVAIAVPGKS